jgi:opacity protein-like surface antigen
LLTSIAGTAEAFAQAKSDNTDFARVNTFGVFAAYSNDSSHILLGDAENRKLLEFGVSYRRRLLHNNIVNWQYNGELLPVALESDPRGYYVNNQTSPTVVTHMYYVGSPVSCTPLTYDYGYIIQNPSGGSTTYRGTVTNSCKGRKWAMGEGMSPVGFQWNFLPRRKQQPFLIAHGGYMYSSQEVPVNGAGCFNFTFDFGAGVEIYRSKTRSVRAEYRYHHISNHNTADENPGIDNGLFQVTYDFGR